MIRRTDLEHTFRFREQSMGWTTGGRGWCLLAAFAWLGLVHTRVADLRPSWEDSYDPRAV